MFRLAVAYIWDRHYIVTFLVNSKAFISNYKFEDFGMILHSLATVVLSRSFTFRIIRLSRNTTGDIIWIL